MTTTYLDDGNWYSVETIDDGEELGVVLRVTSIDVWLSPAEARALAAALVERARDVEREAA